MGSKKCIFSGVKDSQSCSPVFINLSGGTLTCKACPLVFGNSGSAIFTDKKVSLPKFSAKSTLTGKFLVGLH